MIGHEILGDAALITVFVAVMMVVVEYVNVWSRGAFTRGLQGSRLRQYLLAALLGATPGCLGAYVVVTLHVQRGMSLGAVVAAMLATSGDELFVMLAMVPTTAVVMTAGLVAVGVVAGWVTDILLARVPQADRDECCGFVEEHEVDCDCWPEEGVRSIWRRPTAARAGAAAILLLFLVAVALGWIGEEEGWSWIRVAFLVVGTLGLLVVITASEPFFREHVWAHVARGHAPMVFLWASGALAAIAVLEHFVDASSFIADNRWVVLIGAALIGLVPTSGPHLVFVTLFAQGTLPLSVLVASSAVQDGHAMLPLLAHSRRDFFIVKAVNLAFGLSLGAAMMAMGL